MKVIGINGSPRKNKNSAQLLDSALKGAQSAGAETERIDLASLDFSGCISCFGCKRLGGKSFGRCRVKDDLQPVLDKILSADAVIVSAPVYFGDVPGMVRNLFERLWFPGLLYRKDGQTAYDKKVKTGLIYTMNVADGNYYSNLISSHKGTFEWLLGETETMCACDTLQFDDYSLYSGDMFSEEHKKAHREQQFPADLQNAYEMGRRLAE